jgi:hypothetical protein
VEAVRKRARPVSVFLTVLMLMLLIPHQPALAKMIGTETALEAARTGEARNYLNRLLTSEDVQTALVVQGIDPIEARARIDSLSDAEVNRLAGQIEQLPAGAGPLWVGIVIVAYLVVMIALLLSGFWD